MLYMTEKIAYGVGNIMFVTLWIDIKWNENVNEMPFWVNYPV